MALDPQAEWARLLLTSLADAGVRHVVVSPGSRSTPFLWAASRERRLELHNAVDERAAGYFALGLARVTGDPALLLSTSGTAVANYLPAVVEAGVGHVPLLVLTADRPMELVHCGANQTIDQLKIFGNHARVFFDLGRADTEPAALRGLRRTVAQAVFTATWPEPGAVHLNARARKPLEPSAKASQDSGTVEDLLSRPIPQPLAPRRLAPEPALDELAEALDRAQRPVVVCGPAPISWQDCAPHLATLVERAGAVLYADPASQLRFGTPEGAPGTSPALDALLRGEAFRQFFQPDLVLQIGRGPTSTVWERHLAALSGVDHRVIAPWGWQDPVSTAASLLVADPQPTLAALTERLAQGDGTSWRTALERCEVLAEQEAAAVLSGESKLSEAAVARALVHALPDQSFLVVGNSLPIRHLGTWCRRDRPLRVISQRGASGIDGLVAGAAGAAIADGGVGALLVGDVSFLHDLSALGLLPDVPGPLAVVILHNGGGRIFEQLPVARHADLEPGEFDHWTTPHDADFGAACAIHRLLYERVESLEELGEALAETFSGSGVRVIEARVPPQGAAELSDRYHQRLAAKVAEVLAGQGA